jgi:tetratricopeptide (TPR) repeat protein
MRCFFRLLALIPLIAGALSAVDVQMPKGFEHFYNLEYDQAISEFRALIEKQPDNPNYHNHLAQAILYREMFRAGALESELVSGTNPFIRRDKVNTSSEAAAQFDQEIAKSMSLSQAVISKNANDKTALYSLGVAHGLRANYNFLVRKAWRDSLKDATAARKAHNRVVELDPNYIDARLIQGVHDYVVGSLPWHWKMLGFIAGYRGDREEGMKTLRLVAEKGSLNQYDAQVLLAAIYRREKRPNEALPLLNKLTARFPRNYLFRLETVQMYSDAGDKLNALAALDKIEQMKRSGTHGWTTLSLEKIYYYRGNLLFWYRDFDAAVDQLRKATAKATDLDPHTALMAWMRLGQASDMKGQRNEAMDAYKKAIAVAPQSDVARESRQYLSSPYRRS